MNTSRKMLVQVGRQMFTRGHHVALKTLLCTGSHHRKCHVPASPEHGQGSTNSGTDTDDTESNQIHPTNALPSTDQDYFRTLGKSASLSRTDHVKFPLDKTLAKAQAESELTISEDSDSLASGSDPAHLDLYQGIDIANLKPAIPVESFNLATYVSKSDTLTNLVKLGVDLSKVEKDRSIANQLLKLDFKKDIEPLLGFFHKIGLADSDLAPVLSRNPKLFCEDVGNLCIRVDYLKSKKFLETSIVHIASKAPAALSMTTTELDAQLGYLQQEFRLKGDEIRTSVTRCPKLLVWRREKLKATKFTLTEFMGFTNAELKELLLTTPRVLLSGGETLSKRFEYIHNEMGLDHRQILDWPGILRTRLLITEGRHKFLKHLGRDQFDPTKENYVSTKALVTGTDTKFCENVAKVPVKLFNDFLKTL